MKAMRNIVIISMACELLLLGGAVLAGAPVVALMRAAARRGTNAVALGLLALAMWVLAGLAINGVVGLLPRDGQLAVGLVRIGEVDFNMAVFAPMMLVSLAILYLLAVSLIAAGKGRALTDCLRIAARINAP
jgi:hypothetical protein